MRINFEANEATVNLLKSLRDRNDSTYKGVIVGALQFLKWSLDKQDQGLVIAAIQPDDGADRIVEYHTSLTPEH